MPIGWPPLSGPGITTIGWRDDGGPGNFRSLQEPGPPRGLGCLGPPKLADAMGGPRSLMWDGWTEIGAGGLFGVERAAPIYHVSGAQRGTGERRKRTVTFG